MTKILFGLFVAFMCFEQCQANPLDDCTLQHMAGVTSDAAAKFIRESCLGKISAPIPIESLNIATKGGIAKDQYSSGNAFYMTFENKSAYAITEIMVKIVTDNGSKTNEYRVNRFLEIYTGPGMVTGLPPDPATYMQIKPFSSVYFAFPVHQDAPAKDDKWWFQVISAKGYLAN
jgi:hypothetical protein